LNGLSLLWGVVRAALARWFAQRPKGDGGAM